MFEEIFEEIEKEFNKPLLVNLNKKSEDFSEVFSSRRIELIRAIQRETFNSIRELAQSIDRDIKNVWGDLEILEKHHIISLRKEGRRKVPKLRRKCIVFYFE